MDATRVNCVVLVEDDPDTLQAMVRLLTRNGYAVFPATTLREATEIAARERCQVLIADLGLPDGSGLDLMRQLAPPGVIGIAISGHGALEMGQAARDAGFQAYLVKPVRFAELLETLARLTRG